VNGSQIDLISYDTGGDNQQAVILARKLATENKVFAILGPVFSAESAVAFAQAKQLEVPIISASAAQPGLAAANKPWAFTAQATDVNVQKVVSKRFVDLYHAKRFAIITDVKDGWSKSVVKPMVEALVNAGATVINANDPVTYQTGDTDFSVQITKLKSLKPDAIVLAGLYTEGAAIGREMKRQHLDVPALGGMGATDTQLIAQGGDAVNGWVVPTTFWPDSPDPKVKAFTQAIVERAKLVLPDYPAPDKNVANMYDAVKITAQVMAANNVDGNTPIKDARLAIQKGWSEVKNFTGVSGTMTMDENHEANRSVLVLMVKGGSFVPVSD
jgi:branched-chain amino acid transport system substrate-binding protein